MAWSVLSLIPKVCTQSYLKEMHIFYLYVYQSILDQVNRDKNVKTLLEDIHDVFNLGKLVDSLGAIKSGSTQAQILTAMLQHVCNCGDFIQSYAKNTQFCMYILPNSFLTLNMSLAGQRIMKSFIGQDDAQIEDYRSSLFRLRDLFLNHATVTTEITVVQILDNMAKLDGISTQIADASAYSYWSKS